jgi:hypothetical protein
MHKGIEYDIRCEYLSLNRRVNTVKAIGHRSIHANNKRPSTNDKLEFNHVAGTPEMWLVDDTDHQQLKCRSQE